MRPGNLVAGEGGTSVGVAASFLLFPSRTLHNLLVHALHNLRNRQVR